MSQPSLVALLPGLVVLAVGAVLASVFAPFVPGITDLLLAIAIGLVLSNVVGVPERAKAGIETHTLWLATGIVLMGASVTLDRILESGLLVLLVVLGVTTLTLVSVEVLSRVVFNLGETLSSLLAAGSSICGVSAVVAVAGAIQAREAYIAYAAATVLLFDAVTLFVYPILGEVLSIPAKVFGIWAGVTMFSTGPVVAVGFTHSSEAGQWATVTKLSRNALIGLVAIVYAGVYARLRSQHADSVGLATLWEHFPKFILGFVFVMLLASSGVLSDGQLASLENTYNWLFLLAFVGLGTEIRLGELRRAGATPALVVLLTFITMSVLSLGVLFALFGS